MIYIFIVLGIIADYIYWDTIASYDLKTIHSYRMMSNKTYNEAMNDFKSMFDNSIVNYIIWFMFGVLCAIPLVSIILVGTTVYNGIKEIFK